MCIYCLTFTKEQRRKDFSTFNVHLISINVRVANCITRRLLCHIIYKSIKRNCESVFLECMWGWNYICISRKISLTAKLNKYKKAGYRLFVKINEWYACDFLHLILPHGYIRGVYILVKGGVGGCKSSVVYLNLTPIILLG